MSINVQLNGQTAKMIISGRFDSSVYRDFKACYEPLLKNSELMIIETDVSAVEYLDSAALGMLVQLKESAKLHKKNVTLISVPGTVSDILKVANADKLFSINLPSGIKLDLR